MPTSSPGLRIESGNYRRRGTWRAGRRECKCRLVMSDYLEAERDMGMSVTGSPDGPTELTSEQFETTVREILDGLGASLKSFATRHKERLTGVDGSYEIDVTARFGAMGAKFLVLVECKHQRTPVKRDAVQILHDRIRSTGAHKGILFSSSGFQKGAIQYALTHGIALVRVADQTTAWLTLGVDSAPRPSLNVSEGFVGWLMTLSSDGEAQCELVTGHDVARLRSYLGIEDTP